MEFLQNRYDEPVNKKQGDHRMSLGEKIRGQRYSDDWFFDRNIIYAVL